MKNLLPFLTVFLLLSVKISSQDLKLQAEQAKQTPVSKKYFQISPRIGYDFPTYNNSTPYVDYEGGLILGLSFDYYWSWFGIGLDFDYIHNQPNNSYPTKKLINANTVALADFTTTEDNISRDFYGIGPNFKYQLSNTKEHIFLYLICRNLFRLYF